MDLHWFLVGFSIAALAMGFGWRYADEEATDPESPEEAAQVVDLRKRAELA